METVLALMSVVLFVVATNTQTGWLYLVSAILVMALVLGFLGPRRAFRGLEVERRTPPTAARDQSFGLAVEVRAPRAATRLVVVEQGPWPWEAEPDAPRRSLLVDVEKGSRTTVRQEIRPVVRGLHRLGPIRLLSLWPFGLFPASRSFEDDSTLLIYPSGPVLRSHPLERASRRRAHEAVTTTRAGASHELRRVRTYTPGEDLRHVHWPSSARTGQLMVREFRHPGAQRLVVALANPPGSAVGEYPRTTLEDAVSAAASLAHFAWEHALPFGLATHLEGRAAWLVDPPRAELLDLLARVRDDAPEPWESSLATVGTPCDLLVLLPVLPTPSAVDRLAGLRAQGCRVVVIFFFGPSYAPELADDPWSEAARRLESAGSEVRLHRAGADLREVLEA